MPMCVLEFEMLLNMDSEYSWDLSKYNKQHEVRWEKAHFYTSEKDQK